MAITEVGQLIGSPTYGGTETLPTATAKYFVRFSSAASVSFSAAREAGPDWNEMFPYDSRLTVLTKTVRPSETLEILFLDVEYGLWTWDPSADYNVEYDFSAEQTNKKSVDRLSLQDEYPVPPGGDATTMLLNVTKDGEAEGAQIYTPAAAMRVTFRIPMDNWNTTYARNLVIAEGSVNAVPFVIDRVTWAAGEVLYIGARIRDVSTSEKEITLNFLCSINVENLDMEVLSSSGPVVTPIHVFIDKGGWQYLWTQMSRYVTAAGETRDVNGKVFVATVYRKENFTFFDIPGL